MRNPILSKISNISLVAGFGSAFFFPQFYNFAHVLDNHYGTDFFMWLLGVFYGIIFYDMINKLIIRIKAWKSTRVSIK